MSLIKQDSPFGEEFNVLTKSIVELGFDGVLYSFYPRPLYLNEKVQPVLHFSDVLAPFVYQYVEHKYGNRDFVLRMALAQNEKVSIDWWEEVRAGNVKPNELAVTKDAKENFGIHHGLSIPALSGTFAIAGISVVSTQESLTDFEKLKTLHENRLFALAENYHSAMMNSKQELRFFMEPLLKSLNPTQRKVVKHVLSGKPMKTIPDTFGVSEGYGEQVFYKLRTQFGKSSTQELIYLLGMCHAHEVL